MTTPPVRVSPSRPAPLFPEYSALETFPSGLRTYLLSLPPGREPAKAQLEALLRIEPWGLFMLVRRQGELTTIHEWLLSSEWPDAYRLAIRFFPTQLHISRALREQCTWKVIICLEELAVCPLQTLLSLLEAEMGDTYDYIFWRKKPGFTPEEEVRVAGYYRTFLSLKTQQAVEGKNFYQVLSFLCIAPISEWFFNELVTIAFSRLIPSEEDFTPIYILAGLDDKWSSIAARRVTVLTMARDHPRKDIFASEIFALMIFHCDGLLALKPKEMLMLPPPQPQPAEAFSPEVTISLSNGMKAATAITSRFKNFPFIQYFPLDRLPDLTPQDADAPLSDLSTKESMTVFRAVCLMPTWGREEPEGAMTHAGDAFPTLLEHMVKKRNFWQLSERKNLTAKWLNASLLAPHALGAAIEANDISFLRTIGSCVFKGWPPTVTITSPSYACAHGPRVSTNDKCKDLNWFSSVISVFKAKEIKVDNLAPLLFRRHGLSHDLVNLLFSEFDNISITPMYELLTKPLFSLPNRNNVTGIEYLASPTSPEYSRQYVRRHFRKLWNAHFQSPPPPS